MDHGTLPTDQRLDRRPDRRPAFRRAAVLVAAWAGCLGLVSGCSSSTELDSTGADRTASDGPPAWVEAGQELAAEQLAADAARNQIDDRDDDRGSSSRDDDEPTTTSLIESLRRSGLPADQVACVEGKLREEPSLVGPASVVLDAAISGRTPTGIETTQVSALLVAFSPCFGDVQLPAIPTIGSPGAANPLSALLPGVDLAGLSATTEQLRAALEAAQGDAARNLLAVLAGALAAGAAGGLPAPATPPPTLVLPSLPSIPTVTLPPDFPTGLNVVRLVDRTTFVDRAVGNGADRTFAGCLYDNLAALTNEQAAALQTDAAAFEALVGRIFTCSTT